ncbi:MAG TPA: bifunctional 3-demethylubiquinol 3-O-methyltransferase/2-polyprenyl-6-hydroxyphenol methylase, partial [Reyranellaceae bacterium]|nr:bifunctional 3-demethylubiquinol 3-O-methyltransferase/2-polyprenyl-6-hydroxyphenol methylase [Reyranellaceae bacterium]
LFLQSIGRLTKPRGLVFLSMLNHTAKAWALAIAGEECVLRWLPRGTHDWKKFLKPSEVTRGLDAAGVDVQEIVGVVYSPLSRWSLNTVDLDVNYMLWASKRVV